MLDIENKLKYNAMTTDSLNPKVNFFLLRVKKWRKELLKLRMIILDCDLTEELKWGYPCYTYQNNDVVLIHGFKEYCAIMFFKGDMLNDENYMLTSQTENVRSSRQIRFRSLNEIIEMEPTLKVLIQKAIEVEKAGLNVNPKSDTDISIPEEFQKKLKEIPALKTAFASLTPRRQRAYLLYFSASKYAKTREYRVEKFARQMLWGKGFAD
jgi:uncharacterized protein YdeI (YjbR/CyaY-like superfamily)